MMRLVVRWLPGREVVFVADSSFAALEPLDKVKTLPRGSVITRLRLDAALYDPPPSRAPGTKGRPRLTGKHRPTLEAVLVDEKTQWTSLLVEHLWGAPRIVGELRKLGINVATSTVEKYRPQRRKPSSPTLSLAMDCPHPRAVAPPAIGPVMVLPEVGGLHHHDERQAA